MNHYGYIQFDIQEHRIKYFEIHLLSSVKEKSVQRKQFLRLSGFAEVLSRTGFMQTLVYKQCL